MAKTVQRRGGIPDTLPAQPPRKPANGGFYKGPERRWNTTRWLGEERRRPA